MRSCHGWTTRNEDRLKREVRVSKEAGRWRFQSKLETEADWTYYKTPLKEDLRDFIVLLERKYRRRRAAHSDILLAKQMLGELNC